MKKLSIILVALLFSQGCATPYQPVGFRGGYDEIQLNDNAFKVSFRGNAKTRERLAIDYALLRSAELTLEKGFKYFMIISEDSQISRTEMRLPERTTYNVSGHRFRNFMTGTVTKTTSGGLFQVTRPSVTNTIVCFKEKPEDGFVYDASIISADLRRKYDLKPEAEN